MARAVGRGGAIDEPKSFFGMLRELPTDTPADSPVTLKPVTRHEDYRDLTRAKLAAGEPAFDFEMPRHDFSDGVGVATGDTVRLSGFRDDQPVALIFGSHT